MKEHVMNLTPAPMQEIRTGNKTIELRLNDEKRKQISVGDTIKFINTEDSNDTLRVKVVDLFLFSSFAELYDNLPLLNCGYNEDNINTASPEDMEMYYSREKQNKYWCSRNRDITFVTSDLSEQLMNIREIHENKKNSSASAVGG